MFQHLDLDLLRAFVMIADTRSFTRASERLFRTQAAISMQIKRLEERVGKSLFMRSPHGSQLTDEGKLLIHYARQMLLLNDEAVADLSVSRPKGTIRVGAPDDYAHNLLPRVFLLFNEAFPEVQLEVIVDSPGNLVQEVRDGNLDLAVAMRQIRSSEGELLRRKQLAWITSIRKSPHTSDLLPLALCSNGCVRRDIALRTLKAAGRRFKVVLSSGTMPPIVAAVSAGVAITPADELATFAGTRPLRHADGLPPLGTVDIALYRAPGHQRHPAVVLAELIRFSLTKETLVAPLPTAQ
ncbi:LysR substrate-binding domain-containing protein [Bradyrhizobium sp. 144]|uniref:LysR substrate-binding domain-containing protein n=1 Tax=Bradyrhizobium sp. 144 TaxID=2782620 RepID=UPI001FF9F4A7|nr:LysR substrate-binding domain-containing protein [Bradyrhizobium sp. 144]MCK1694247.1 LysR family transcriptional regulator [Bradyrhizobium sp. 144]